MKERLNKFDFCYEKIMETIQLHKNIFKGYELSQIKVKHYLKKLKKAKKMKVGN